MFVSEKYVYLIIKVQIQIFVKGWVKQQKLNNVSYTMCSCSTNIFGKLNV